MPAGSLGRGKCPCKLKESLRCQKTSIWCHSATGLAVGLVCLGTVLHTPNVNP